MMMAITLTPELIRQLIYFDGESYFWRERERKFFSSPIGFAVWNGRNAGKKTLTAIDFNGYAIFRFQRKTYCAHRVIWAYHYGEWPTGQIDHINHDRADNRLENLRDVTHAENAKNQRIRSTNKSGFIGVSWFSQTKKWKSSIFSNGKTKHLGYFSEKSAAVAARKNAERKIGFHPNHGKAERKVKLLCLD
jgi:HNH endonuclease